MAVPYRSTAIFDEKTLPAALRGEHKTKAGTWGVILPDQPHRVEPLGPMRMQVHFYDQAPDLRDHHRQTGPIAAPKAITA